MEIWMIVIVVVAAALGVLLIAMLLGFASKSRRSGELRGRFGPEYDRTVDEYGDRGEAEKDIRTRAERVDRLQLQPLSNEERQRFSEAWRSTQNFVC